MTCTYEFAFQIEPIGEARELDLVKYDLIFSQFGRIHSVLCSEVAQDGVAAAKAARAKLERLGVTVKRALLDLVNKADIADRAEVSKPAVAEWVKQYNGAGGFPEEHDTISGHPVWVWADVNEWLRREGKPVFDSFMSLNRREVEEFNHWLNTQPRSRATTLSARKLEAAVASTHFVVPVSARGQVEGFWVEHSAIAELKELEDA